MSQLYPSWFLLLPSVRHLFLPTTMLLLSILSLLMASTPEVSPVWITSSSSSFKDIYFGIYHSQKIIHTYNMQTVHIHIYNVYKWYTDEHNTSLVFAHLKSNEYQAALCHLEGKKEVWRAWGCLQRPGRGNSMALFQSYNSIQMQGKPTNAVFLCISIEKMLHYTCHYLWHNFIIFIPNFWPASIEQY